MKKIITAALLAIIVTGAFSQVSGKYVAEQLVSRSDTDTIFTSYTYPVEVSGDNYLWQFTSKWKNTSVATTSTVKMQVSPDGSTWMNYGTADSLKASTTSYFTGTDTPFKWMRLNVAVTSGDTIIGFNAWYEFRRK